MGFLWRRPCNGALSALVDRFWCIAGDVDHADEVLLPTGRAELVFGLDLGAFGGLIQGPMSRAASIDASMQRRAIGVSFLAGGVDAFINERTDVLSDMTLDLEHLWGSSSVSLLDELASTSSSSVALDRLEADLLGRLDPGGGDPDPMLSWAERRIRGGVPVAAVASAVGLDPRGLSMLFRGRFGFGLKRYGQICRFEIAVAQLRCDEAAPLAAIAAEVGFADQAHMTREFRAMCGYTPGMLHRRPGPSVNHVVADEIFKTTPRTAMTMAS